MPTLSEAMATALAHHQAGRFDLAEDIYRRILAVEPEQAEALHLWGVIAHQRGQHALAAERIRQAIALAPATAGFHSNLGEVCRALGEPHEALSAYRRALELNPQLAAAHNGLGLALESLGQVEEALACYRRAVECDPGLAEAHYNLGVAWHKRGDLDAATVCLRRALELNPRFADAWNNLGATLADLGQHSAAISCYQRTLQLNAGDLEARVNMGTALLGLGRLDEALDWYREALALDPNCAPARSNLLLSMQYSSGVTLAELATALAEYDRRHVVPLRPRAPDDARSRDPERPLRIGFVSADFHQHPVGGLYLRPMECLRSAEMSLFAYFTGGQADGLTARFRAAAHTWRAVPGISDEALAALIRADQIDILFELASHAAGNRLLTFARQPAPIQIAWAGPTGVSTIDYLLADANLVPAGLEQGYRERVLRMPDTFTCYAPPPEAPAVTPLPALHAGRVTFGSPNNLAKVTSQVIQTWAEILRRVPGSRLLFRYGNATRNPDAQQRLRAMFAAAGLGDERLAWGGWVPHAERLNVFHEIDLVLDPFPFSGCMTTCEALWMGVPVITCPGETYMSRQSLSLLRTVGLADAVATDGHDYIQRAVLWASDLPRLAAVRRGLREQMAQSPLCDGPRFAAHLTRLLRDVWRRWCATREVP
jgi:predicted O-linked N-acetylglucosamine transferase (SPINDLY family)